MKKILFLLAFGLIIGGFLHAQVPENWLLVYQGEKTSDNPGSNALYVIGWSSDGKVALYEENNDMLMNRWMIIDTKTDECITEQDYVDFPSGYPRLEETLSRFNISENPGRITTEDREGISLDTSDIPGSRSGWTMDADIIVSKGSSRKAITKISYYIAPMEKPVENFYLIKSPFEERILVIIPIDGFHAEFDYLFRHFAFSGCHLEYGF